MSWKLSEGYVPRMKWSAVSNADEKLSQRGKTGQEGGDLNVKISGGAVGMKACLAWRVRK